MAGQSYALPSSGPMRKSPHMRPTEQKASSGSWGVTSAKTCYHPTRKRLSKSHSTLLGDIRVGTSLNFGSGAHRADPAGDFRDVGEIANLLLASPNVWVAWQRFPHVQRPPQPSLRRARPMPQRWGQGLRCSREESLFWLLQAVNMRQVWTCSYLGRGGDCLWADGQPHGALG